MFPPNLQVWPTLAQFISYLNVVIIGVGETTLANSGAEQVIAFGQTFSAPPSFVAYWFTMPSGVSTIIGGNLVDGSVTDTGFSIVLDSLPGDILHKIGWAAFS